MLVDSHAYVEGRKVQSKKGYGYYGKLFKINKKSYVSLTSDFYLYIHFQCKFQGF
jgi:hypothetical protein